MGTGVLFLGGVLWLVASFLCPAGEFGWAGQPESCFYGLIFTRLTFCLEQVLGCSSWGAFCGQLVASHPSSSGVSKLQPTVQPIYPPLLFYPAHSLNPKHMWGVWVGRGGGMCASGRSMFVGEGCARTHLHVHVCAHSCSFAPVRS